MIYRFVLLSDEDDFFKREIHINADATFFEFRDTIFKSVDYDASEMSTFYLCDSEWEKELEISLFERETGYDEDSYVMDKTRLNDLLSEEEQQLFFVFDMLMERGFFVQLAEIIPGKSLKRPVVTESEGDAPQQTSMPDLDELTNITAASAGVTAEFDGNEFDDAVDLDDLDPDSFSPIDESSLEDLY